VARSRAAGSSSDPIICGRVRLIHTPDAPAHEGRDALVEITDISGGFNLVLGVILGVIGTLIVLWLNGRIGQR
jgi:hypothetical protein